MIQFQISAPASASLFGEHTSNIIKASIDLRTTLNFQELNCSNNIEINFPQINLFHKIPLQKFLNLYDKCVEDMRGLYFHVTMLTWSRFRDNKRFLQIFYHLLVRIMYKQQIARAEIKTFRIDLFTNLPMDEKFACLSSLKVCLAACFLHWARLQKGIQNTFDDIDLHRICTYATQCELDISVLDEIDLAM